MNIQVQDSGIDERKVLQVMLDTDNNDENFVLFRRVRSV